jgi:hypothetical protein
LCKFGKKSLFAQEESNGFLLILCPTNIPPPNKLF